ncbi:MAG: VTT domain-containing protein [Acidobacteriota bacterium]
MSEPQEPAKGRGGLLVRLAILAALLLSGALLMRLTPVGELLDKERMIELLSSVREEPWAPFALIALFCVVAVLGLPVSPVLIGGGAVFGRFYGTIYCGTGLVTAAMVAYFVGKMLGREALVQLTGSKLKRAEKIFERRGFWALVQTRFLPIPFPIVAYGAALAGVSTWRYFITSSLGLLPSTVLHTWYAPAILLAVLDGQKPVRLVIEYGIGMTLFNVVASLPQIREFLRRKARYRELQELRARRTEQRASASPGEPEAG